ncbi:MAG: S8 family serine peptidase [Methanoregula sp.]
MIINLADTDARQRKEIEKSVSRVLATYPDALLADVTEEQLGSLRKKGIQAEVQKNNQMIRLRSIEFDSSKVPTPPQKLQLKATDMKRKEKNVWIVQFVGPAKPEWGEELSSLGAQTGGYIPENAFLVNMPPDTAEKVKQLPFVAWVGVYEPAFKISPLLAGKKGKFTSAELRTMKLVEFSDKSALGGNINVILHDGSDLKAVSSEIKKLGGKVIGTAKDRIRISVGTADIETIARINTVKWIEPYGIPKLFNDVAAGIIGVREVWDNHGLDGEGQIVAVADTGLDTGVNDATMHDDFEGRIVNIHSWAIPAGLHPYLNNASWDDGAADLESGHGTHVSGSVLGNGAKSGGSIRGMAYNSRLVFQAVEQWLDLKPGYGTDGYYLAGIPDDVKTLFQQAYNDGARVHSNSWGAIEDNDGNSITGDYTAETNDIDEFIWNHKDYAVLFSTANAGIDADHNGVVDPDSLSIQSSAKNCISVGASENNRATGGYNPGGPCDKWGNCWPADYPTNPIKNDPLSNNPEGMAAFSSRGPTTDGRIKPDVVAPGTNILSVRSSMATEQGWGLLPAADTNRPYYMYMGGTSMSTPLTAGTVVLIRQYVVNACLHANPSAALLKALLVHGAHPMTGQYDAAHNDVGTVPDNNQGWGRVDLKGSLFPDYPEKMEFRDDTSVTLGTGEQRDYTFSVVNTTVPFRATLVWTDYPSDVAAGGSLVNTLRLSIIPPAGAEVVGAPANNNVQRAVVQNPQVGTYTVRVRGVSVNTQTMAGVNKKQDFALVTTGGLDFLDLYIRDNAADTGIPPSTGTMYLSPDIWVSLTNDPAEPPAPNPEYGQTNFVFVKVRNRGPKAASNATVKLYWANPGTNLSRPYWQTDGILVDGAASNSRQLNVPARSAGGDGEAIADAFEWTPPDPNTDIADPGHFCLFATVDHPDDPLLQEDIDRVRWEDNLAWKNVVEQDMVLNSSTSIKFYVAGNKGAQSIADLHIDRSGLPSDGKVKLKLPNRYLADSTITNLLKVWESAGHISSQVEVTSATTADIQGIRLKSNENTLLMLEVTLPKKAKDGDVFPVYIEQRTNGTVTGRVTLAARTMATPAYIANRNSGEIHLSNCGWAKKISGSHKIPFNDLDLAIQRGYNGCRFCLTKYDTG